MPTYKNRKCYLCENQIEHVDYKNIYLLKKFLTQYNKMVPRYYSGTCIKHQKKLSPAIKNARIMSLIQFST
jgi:small subunit ribosomal protein S18